METQRPALSRQRKAGHLLRLYRGLLHPSFALARRWRLPIASKPVLVRNTCSRKILRCAPTICLFMELSSLEQSTSICCLRCPWRLRTQLALVFQIQRSSRSDEKSSRLGGSTLGSATSISSRIQRVRPITAFHSRSTGG